MRIIGCEETSRDCIYQDEIKWKILNRIRDKINEWYLYLLGAVDEKKLLNDLEMYRRFTKTLSYLESHFDKIQVDEIYKGLKSIFEEIKFKQDEINELMSLIKILDRDHLGELLFLLEIEFSRHEDTITTYLDYKHCSDICGELKSDN